LHRSVAGKNHIKLIWRAIMTDIDRIIKFFLHIFQIQAGGSGDIEGTADYQLVSPEPDPSQIYELRVKLLSEWKKRRMSIRKIGESVESKSTCYVVTYDDLLVVKIPPYPLADFNSYLKNIHIELGIAKRLSPVVRCLVPTLSSILQKVPELTGKIPADAPDMEAAYVELLTKEPRYHGYLKIGDRFAFFMSLSKHPFLNQVIEKIHGDRSWLKDEIYKNSRVFQSLDTFEAIYGSQKIVLYDRIHEMIKDFSRKADAMLTLYGGDPPVPDYQKQEWMFAALAGKPIHIDASELPTEFCEDIQNLLNGLVHENKESVDDYKKTVSSYIRRKNFNKNKTRIEALIVNTLDLICRLKHSNVAVRDLKPDNILVMGIEGDVYSHLSVPEKYELGLIDLETAVDFHQEDPNQIRQPMLAGTSVYMTPAHIFKNSLLMEVYGKDISRIFYMQDWFSVIGIIYDIVKGRLLFKKTSLLIPEIVRARKRGLKNNTPMADIVASVSRFFWKTAEEELSAAIKRDQEVFQLIELTLPEHIVEMFFAEIQEEKKVLQRMIQKYAYSQKYFPKNVQRLIDASHEEIRALRIKWESDTSDIQLPPGIHQRIIEMLNSIEKLKFNVKGSDGLVEVFQKPVTCEVLLGFLFQRVSAAMNPF
jgi:serine/threonine protein kinase